MKSENYMKWSVLWANTFAFTICFAVWMMFAVIGIPIKTLLNLTETQFGLLTAMPVLTGALIRLPLGMWTDKFGGRIVYFILMLSTILPIYLLQYATEYWHFLVGGMFVGIAGGSFSVGIACVAKWFDKKRQGTAMGIFGAGNVGAALTKFVAPAIVVAWGWTAVPTIYAGAMLVTALLFWFFTFDKPEHHTAKSATLGQQLSVLKDWRVWKYSQYYFIVFGGYVALALWMTKYYIGQYGFDLKTAALLAACFSLPGGILRAVGGICSDKWGAHRVTFWVFLVSMVCLGFLAFPSFDIVLHGTKGDIPLSFGLDVYTFTGLMFLMGIAWAIGKASVFKYISDEYTTNIGAVSGVVGLMGGLGGFVLPIAFGALMDLTGLRTSCFMLLLAIVFISMTWMYLTEVKAKHGKHSHQPDILE